MTLERLEELLAAFCQLFLPCLIRGGQGKLYCQLSAQPLQLSEQCLLMPVGEAGLGLDACNKELVQYLSEYPGIFIGASGQAQLSAAKTLFEQRVCLFQSTIRLALKA